MTARSDSDATGVSVILADPCKDNFFAEMESILDNFFSKVTRVGNFVLDLPNQIKLASKNLLSIATGFINALSGSLSDRLVKFVQNGLKDIADTVSKALFGEPVTKIIAKIGEEQTKIVDPIKALFKGLECVAAKVIQATQNVFSDLLSSAVKNVLNVPRCAVEQILGAFSNKVINLIDSFVRPLLEPLEKAFNFVFKARDFLVGSANLMRKVTNLFKCGEKQKCPASTKYVINKGLSKDIDDQFKNIDNAISQAESAFALVNSGFVGSFAEREYGKWNIFGKPLSEASPLDPCYIGNIFECGTPKVEFFGGGGIGAAGSVILGKFVDELDPENALGSVKKTASIIGVQIDNPGSGYEDAPFVTFSDNCDKGYGAYGRAIIENGQVKYVVITSNGENYPAEVDQQDDIFYIDDVIIENPGQDYQETDTTTGLDLKIVDGKISSVDIQDVAFNGYPDLNINSSTGYGAILRPIMRIVPPQKEVIRVIDCVK